MIFKKVEIRRKTAPSLEMQSINFQCPEHWGYLGGKKQIRQKTGLMAWRRD